jgi:DNA-binding CsgD family transcriptional regulator
MLQATVYLVFIFSAAFASAGIILASRLRSQNRTNGFAALMYYQVFIFTFGFYGIWGRVILKVFLEKITSPAAMENFSNISALLGLPFLVFAWLMLTRFAREISGRTKNDWYAFWFLLVNFSLLFLTGYFLTRSGITKPDTIIRYYFISLSVIYTLLSAVYILFPLGGSGFLQKYEAGIFSFSLIISIAAQCFVLANYHGETVMGIIFIFLFFAGSCFAPLYLSYGTVLSVQHPEITRDLSFDEFCRAYEVTPRESEIILEICKGLSNKEISGKLFITIQTVKDHTHRIYSKINVRNRVQLINLVKELKAPGS